MPDGSTFPWPPRALPEKAAAYYVGLSPSTFRAEVMPQVPPVRLTTGRVAWLREDLDAWLDRQAGRKAVDAVPALVERPGGDRNDDPIAAALANLGSTTKGRAARQGAPRRR